MPLSSEQRKEALRLRKYGKPNGRLGWRHVAKIMGVPERWLLAAFMPGHAEAIEFEKKLKDMRISLGMRSPPAKRIIPAHVLEERDRLNAIEQTPNMAILGDPVPFRSALYKARERT